MNAAFDVTGIRLETARLVLRPWEQGDLQDFYEYAHVDGVGQMAGWMPHGDISESQKILDMFIEGRRTFAIWHKADRKVIGSLGIEQYNEAMTEFSSYRGREIGYVLSKSYWGKGLMPEAVKAVIDYLFDTLQYDFLTCGFFDFNSQSARVQEKLGFEKYRKLVFTTRTATNQPGYLNILLNPKKDVRLERNHPETLVYKPLVMTAEQMWEKSGLEGDYQAWAFGGIPNPLAGLVLKGEKRATTSQRQLYDFEGEPIPMKGERSVILNSEGFAVCIIENTDVKVVPFKDVDDVYAYTEGEGDKSLAYWQDVHREIFTDELKEEMDKEFTEDDLVVCEYFDVVYR